MLSLSTPPKPDQETQEGPRAGAFLRLLLMHFYSGLLMYFLSGVDKPAHAKLFARIGIDSGLVVIGKSAGQDADVFGDAPNIAARVEAAAQPGTVAITDATQRLVSGLFVVEDLGAQTLKGIERPLQLYRVIRPSGMRGRFEAAAAAGGLTPVRRTRG